MQNNLGGVDPTGARSFQFPGVNNQQANQGFGVGTGGLQQLTSNLQLAQRRAGPGIQSAGATQTAAGQTSSHYHPALDRVHGNLLSGGNNQVFNQNLNLSMIQQQQQSQQQQRLGSALGQANLANITHPALSNLSRTASNVGSGINLQGLAQTRNLQNQGVNLSQLAAQSGRGGLSMIQQQQQQQQQQLTGNTPQNLMDLLRNNQTLSQQLQLSQQQRLNNQISQLPQGAAAASGIQQAAFTGLRKEADDFSMVNDDFPALSQAGGVSRGLGGMLMQNETSVLENKTMNTGLLDSAVQQLQQTQQLVGNQTQQLGQQQRINLEELISGVRQQTKGGTIPEGVNRAADILGALQQNGGTGLQKEESPDRFGLMGLLHVIRMVDQDLTMLALGSNLTDLGLNLNQQDKLYKSFASPWSDTPLDQKPDFKLPSCFYFKPQRIFSGFLHKLSENTLLYAFYSMPGDEAQLVAAEALTNLGWMYHKERKQWIKRAQEGGHIKSDTYEKGNYLAFDFENWHLVRLEGYTLQYDQIEETPQPQKKTQ
eukprot:TRINITY_DN3891_c0_g1_i2.p1 TRINITY_DN3891_c0_g1~~TRINITY_DN3891_c0_g1_i2.p1  ORF type:complete len:540 (+),score=70.04 TRINITY_DN3891_c0_g1_i2:593-2212(+)